MANKRNYEWPQASVWDGYFTQDKVGGTTQRVDPSLVFDRLRAEGFLDDAGAITEAAVDAALAAIHTLIGDGETINHILDLSTLGEENTTFDVVLTANRNNAISFTGTSAQTAIVAIDIEDAKPCNIQIVGACNLAITGVEWWSDAITAVTAKAEINIMNGRAMGVLIDV